MNGLATDKADISWVYPVNRTSLASELEAVCDRLKLRSTEIYSLYAEGDNAPKALQLALRGISFEIGEEINKVREHISKLRRIEITKKPLRKKRKKR